MNHRDPGYEDGRLPTTYYYVPRDSRDALHRYTAIHGAFFNREWPGKILFEFVLYISDILVLYLKL